MSTEGAHFKLLPVSCNVVHDAALQHHVYKYEEKRFHTEELSFFRFYAMIFEMLFVWMELD